jgi:catechol 2,3-dioxygenase-like lactoylglutathione lyase family enzyme
MSTSALEKRQAVKNLDKPNGFARIHGLNHYAFRCRNAEETRHFYEDVLKLPLAATVYHDAVPSTGAYQPYFHIFFELGDGSFLAFFDLLDETAYAADPNTPDWVNHLALDVATRDELIEAKASLERAGVEVLGVVDHKWFDSIYFFDPNGIRLELVYRTAALEEMRDKASKAHAILATRDAKIAELKARKAQPG